MCGFSTIPNYLVVLTLDVVCSFKGIFNALEVVVKMSKNSIFNLILDE